jgi:hypothetical protein
VKKQGLLTSILNIIMPGSAPITLATLFSTISELRKSVGLFTAVSNILDINPLAWFRTLKSTLFMMPDTVPTSTNPSGTFEQYLKDNQLSISNPSNAKIKLSVSGNNVTIFVDFDYIGALWDANLGSGTKTYKQLFKEGIENKWKGTKTVFGYRVTLNTVIESRSNKIITSLNDSDGRSSAPNYPWTKETPGLLNLYKKWGTDYSADDFKNLAAHEFGHLLGVRDAYGIMPDNFNSIYNKPSMEVSNKDLQKVINAFVFDVIQIWNVSRDS